MRWLMIAFLVSLGGLLVAAAGVARHIWLHRARLRREMGSRATAAMDDVGNDSQSEVEDIDREL